tara:strand:+ start:69 stop:557 length:489 start_codon:yes stop_codon:yes gene_type:complete
MPWTKEQKSEYHRQWRINNKEKLAESNKKYREDNKEKMAELKSKFYQKNKEKIAETQKKYYNANKEKKAESNKKYQQTAQGKKVKRISDWKYAGLVDSDKDNYESLYTHYISTQNCEHCNVELTEDKSPTPTRKSMDHSHTTGLFRNILCQGCNTRRRENNF